MHCGCGHSKPWERGGCTCGLARGGESEGLGKTWLTAAISTGSSSKVSTVREGHTRLFSKALPKAEAD